MSISDLVKSTLEELQDLMVSKTVVGDPVKAGDHTVIPVSKVTFGFGGGGGTNTSKKPKDEKGDGQGIGGGWSINPVAFVVIGPDGSKLLTIGEKESAITKLMDLAPKVVETVKNIVESKSTQEKSTEPDKSE